MNMQFPPDWQKEQPLRHLAQLFIWRGGLVFRHSFRHNFRHRHTIKLYKNKIDSKVIKSHQCSLQTSHVVSKKVNYEF